MRTSLFELVRGSGLAMLLFVVGSTAPAEEVFFGVGSPGTLYQINPATGVATEVGPLGAGSPSIAAIDKNPNGSGLIGIASGFSSIGNIYSINTDTGAATSLGAVTGSSASSSSLATEGEIVYTVTTSGGASTTNTLGTLDPSTHVFSPIGVVNPYFIPPGSTGFLIDGLAVSPLTGELFAVDQRTRGVMAESDVMTLPKSGSIDAELVGTINGKRIGSLAFREDGTLFGLTVASPGPQELVSFNLNPFGIASSVTVTGASLSSFAIFNIDTSPPGDHNGDGTVDAADYALWRSNPGFYGGAQGYTDWVDNFGQSLGSGSSLPVNVPEPQSVLLFLVGLLGVRHRTRNAR